MRHRYVALGLGVVAATVAFAFLAPVVPFNTTFYTGTTQPFNNPMPSMHCAVPVTAVDPTLVYQGYESVVYHFSGVGFMFYTHCFMP